MLVKAQMIAGRCRTRRVNVVFTIVAMMLGSTLRTSANEPLKLLGHVRAKHASEIVNSPWGIQAGTLDNDIVSRAAAIGVKWTRLNASWKEIEVERGVYRWEETDKAFASALENGITPFVCLAGSNRLYCGESTAGTAGEKEIYGSNPLPPTRDPRALEAWLRFVRATVERYKQKIHYWEVWNEPNHWAYWGAQPDGEEYGRLLRETAAVIKKVDPSAKVIGGALAGLDPEFVDKFLGAGSASLIDIITFHNYAPTPEERIYKAIEVWDVIRKHNPGLELWQGECGYPSHSSTRDYRGTSPWGLQIQAKWLLRQSFTDIYFCRTTLSNYFKLAHEGGRGKKPKRSSLAPIDSVLGFPERNGSRVKSVGVNEKCILDNPDLNPKPAYFAYQNLCAVFDGRYKAVKFHFSVSVRDQGIFYGVGDEDDAFPSKTLVSMFKTDDDRSFLAYWLPWHPQEMIREGAIDLTMQDCKFREPVLIDLLDGEVYELTISTGNDGSQVFTSIPLADYPYAIAERSQIELQQ